MLSAASPLFVFTTSCVVAQGAPATGAPTLQSVIKHYSSAGSYQATVRTTTTLQPLNGSQPNVINSVLTVAYKTPNLMRVETSGLLGGSLAVSDGRTLSTYLAVTNQYSQTAAPRQSITSLIMASHLNPSTRLVGRVSVGGKMLNEYRASTPFQGQAATTTVYVDPAANVVTRITIVVPKISGPQGGGVRVTTEEEFQAQRFNSPISPALFRFTPPAGAQRGSGAGLGTILGVPGGGIP